MVRAQPVETLRVLFQKRKEMQLFSILLLLAATNALPAELVNESNPALAVPQVPNVQIAQDAVPELDDIINRFNRFRQEDIPQNPVPFNHDELLRIVNEHEA